MKRVTVDMAAKATGLFDVHRFRQRTKTDRESAWRKFRALGVGGSDMSTILGLNQYSTPYELWLEKTGRQQPEDISGKWAIVKGNALEIELRRRFRQLHRSTSHRRHRHQPRVQGASVDARLAGRFPLRLRIGFVRRAGDQDREREPWAHRLARRRWRAYRPRYYMAQVTHYMAVTGFRWGYFYADIGESEPVEVRFERDDDDINAVIHAAEDFWGYVQRDEMPQLTGADVDKAQSMPPYPDGYEQVVDHEFDDLAAMYSTYAQAESNAKKAKEKIADQLKAMVGAEREGLISGGWKAGYRTVHYKEKPAIEAKPAYDQRRFTITQLKTK